MSEVLIAAGVALLGLLALLWWLRRSFIVVDVDGASMEPAYHSGDRVLVRRKPLARIRPGDVVVVARPSLPEGWMLKRVAALPGDTVPASVSAAVHGATRVPRGQCVVLGDNAGSSYDSRRCGFFPADKVLGVVVRRVIRPHR